MAQVVLADEINRATPKTQSALLECMEEKQATIDGVTHEMPTPFLVMATQNPIEYEGTFALPEAQLDRFMLRLRMGYPKAVEEIVILDEQKRRHPIDELRQVIDAEELHQMQMATKEIYVDQAIAEYIVRLTGATREHGDVYLGRLAARQHQPVPRRAGHRGARRPRLRHPGRRQAAGRARSWPIG